MYTYFLLFFFSTAFGAIFGTGSEEAAKNIPTTSQSTRLYLSQNKTVRELLSYRDVNRVSCRSEHRTRATALICNCKNEALGEPWEGMVAVNKLVLARVESALYPNSIAGVVWQGSNTRSPQFSWTGMAKHTHALMTQPTIQQCVDASIQAIGEYEADGFPFLNYHATYINPRWARTCMRWRGTKVDTVGLHRYYSNCQSQHGGSQYQGDGVVEGALSQILKPHEMLCKEG